MSDPIRLAIHGASGRMGRALLDLVAEDARFTLCAALVEPGSQWCDQPVPAVDGLDFAADWDAAADAGVIVDFSSAAGCLAALEHALARGVPLVSGSTGLDAEGHKRLGAAAERIAVLRADNFSLGIAVLTRLLAQAAAALPNWDLEIIEAHHAGKRDAPSGTALALGRAAAAARGIDFEHVAAIDRDGLRRAGDIGFASLRGGDIVGEHQALLCTAGERLELGHRATDRAIFARGALTAAAWIAGRPPGSYTLADVIA